MRVSKTSSYFSRFSVKYRRRREGKTDYQARRRLVKTDKNKYNSPKFRLIVRFSNKNIFCQIAYTTITGDQMFCDTYAQELFNYGLDVGLTNYSTAYCVGLLVARRCLTSFGLDNVYNGTETITGEDYTVEPVCPGPRPFSVIIDTGLKITSTGSKIFGVLKGALDGGLNIPHNEKRFQGYNRITKKYDPEVMRKYIFGGHIADFMKELEEEEPDLFSLQFSQYIKHQVKHDSLEEIYAKAHRSIRANAFNFEKSKCKPKQTLETSNCMKYSYSQRVEGFKQKLASLGI